MTFHILASLLVRMVVLLPFQLIRLSLATPSRWTPLALSVFLHCVVCLLFFFSSRRRHTISNRDWSSDVCSSDLGAGLPAWPAQLPAILAVKATEQATQVGQRPLAHLQPREAGRDAVMDGEQFRVPLLERVAQIGRASVGKEGRARGSRVHRRQHE